MELTSSISKNDDQILTLSSYSRHFRAIGNIMHALHCATHVPQAYTLFMQRIKVSDSDGLIESPDKPLTTLQAYKK
jgi:hypothetical protein